MFSMPPAIATCDSPSRMASAASIIDLRPLPQTLLIVMAWTLSGKPARRIACRAGAWALPPCRTWPMMTSSTASPGNDVRAISCRMTWAASSGAGTSARTPPREPKGVRPPRNNKNLIHGRPP